MEFLNKMKIAICFSGLLRNYKNYIYLFNELTKYKNVDIFFHTWDLEDQLSRNMLFEEDINNIILLLKPKKYIIENLNQKELEFNLYNKWDYKKEHWHSKGSVNFACMYYSIFKSNCIRQEYEIHNNIQYNMVIRHRFDFMFENTYENIFEMDCNNLNLLPINRDSGYCDIFAAGKPEHMNIYSNLFLNYDECCENIKLMRPEDMLKYWIDKHNIPVHIINNKYLIK